ncbi:MAG: aminopeptidase P family protein [Gemmatimonadales bacterium]|nr:aminopeptidase P family protein [Gemmatimonadales bacterium]
MNRIGPALIVVPAAPRGNVEAEVRQDNDFRQDDYFFYLTGIETPGAWLVLLNDGSERTSVLFLPPANPMAQRWTGLQLGPGDVAAELTGIPDVRELDPESFSDTVAAWLAERPMYSVLQRERPNRFTTAWEERGWEVADVRPTLDSMRLVKDEVGIAALRAAGAITADGVMAGMRAVRPGMFEFQLEAVIEYTFRDRGADRLGFPSIVGSGPNSTILHYDVNRRRMERGDLVVVDVGGEFAYHTADITRTFPVSGRFTERQRALYDLVLGTQEAIIAAVRPGATLADLNGVARSFLAEHGGSLCGELECSRYLIHGVSHWLGMRVHDVGDIRTPLAAGMVLTVEPGIYLPEEEIGIRIEDDVLVTEDGAEILTSGVVRTAGEIEALMTAASGRAEIRE